VKYVSLPNIMLGKELYPEFIQHFDAGTIAARAIDMLKDGGLAVKRELEVLSGQLGREDSYSLACDAVTQFLRQRYGALS
jgi:lipid A disaccharide synthetase